MKHLTDEQIREFWAKGPKSKGDYLTTLKHLYDCEVCRDRSWDDLESLRKHMDSEPPEALAEALKASLAKMLGKAPEGFKFLGTVELPGGKSPVKQLMEHLVNHDPEHSIAVMGVSMAIRQIMELGEDEKLDSTKLFGHDAFDLDAHFVGCDDCFNRVKAMYEITQRAIKAKPVADPRFQKAMVRMNAWLALRITQITEARKTPEKYPQTESGGSHALSA